MTQDLLLEQIKEWEQTFMALYKRKPKMIEREQFMLGVIAGTIVLLKDRKP